MTDNRESRDDSNKEDYMRHNIGTSPECGGVRERKSSDTREEWITAKQLAAEYPRRAFDRLRGVQAP